LVAYLPCRYARAIGNVLLLGEVITINGHKNRFQAYKKKGRPKKFSDWQIIAMLAIKEVYSLSFREIVELSKDFFEKVPSLHDFHYRSRKLEHVIQLMIKFIHDYLQSEIDAVIVNGTGVGFKKKAKLNWMRGTQIWKVKDHIRCKVMVTKGQYKLVQYVEVGDTHRR